MKKNKKNKISGLEAFEEYYSFLYGERWPLLTEALKKENVYVKFLHKGKALSLNSENDFFPCQAYFLDPASLVAGLCLPLDNATSVLDLCAAPGGKSLVVASCLQENACLTSNERSPERKNRLSKVISSCLPSALSQKVKVSCSDGALWCKKENLSFDSILLDAPCSSERHVLKSEKYLKDWTPNRVKTMRMEQWALLSSAFRILKEGGYLLYSTCALSKEENDGIIDRLLKKFDTARLLPYQAIKSTFEKNLSKVQNIVFTAQAPSLLDDDFSLEEGGAASLNAPQFSKDAALSSSGKSTAGPDKSSATPMILSTFQNAQATEFGYHILPDAASGSGPIYFSLIKKENSCQY